MSALTENAPTFSPILLDEVLMMDKEPNDQIIESFEPIYTKGQQLALYCLSVPGGFLSMLGSSLISVAILRERPASTGSIGTSSSSLGTFRRILLGLSLMDFIASFSHMCIYWPWSIPKQADYFIYHASGTWATCNLNGFLTNLGTSIQLYSASLALYYVLTVRYQCREAFVTSRIEPWIHGISILWPVGLGFLSIAVQAYSPLVVAPGYCWYADWPPDCDTEDDSEDDGSGDHETKQSTNGTNYPEMKCLRAPEGLRRILFMLVGILPLLLCMITIIVCMGLLYQQVRHTERRLARYGMGANSSRGSGGGRGDLDMSQKTAIKGVLYIGAFLAAHVPYLVLVAVSFAIELVPENGSTIFVFAALHNFMAPWQGLFNAFIFFRERQSLFEEEQGPLHCLWPLVRHFQCCFAPALVRRRTNRSSSSFWRRVSKEEASTGNVERSSPLPADKVESDERDVGNHQLDNSTTPVNKVELFGEDTNGSSCRMVAANSFVPAPTDIDLAEEFNDNGNVQGSSSSPAAHVSNVE
ncbi:expressed unknown protein [Seminavis robusta]|uniref:G-protein coupled receptors family 1 profile domain-containing protein n=1 Tax=Seminavis robusta TaxID=568900 RepID=A0A9N8D6M7_9STRA|nr:expressed unknown protein [Seminavis robusta]|eukprot:Sro1_g000500.1 n/a (527) ;mRNA; f:149463-151043